MNQQKMTISIEAVRPLQAYLSRKRLKNIRNHEKNDITVISHNHDIWLAHGHHAAYHAWKQGCRDMDVIIDDTLLEHSGYIRLIHDAKKRDLNDVSDLKNGILEEDAYIRRWHNKRQLLLLPEKTRRRYLKNPCRQSSLPLYKHLRMKNVKSVTVIHDDAYNGHPEDTNVQSYIRLRHDLCDIPSDNIRGYYIRPCMIPEDRNAIIRMIDQSYPNIRLTEKQLRDMSDDHVYDPSLWQWIIDTQTGEKVALGIAQYDAVMKEVVLDWIQVHPNHRGKGFGKMLVQSLLKGKQGKDRFGTVSCVYRNNGSPVRFYRECGFTGNDVWHVIRNATHAQSH